MEQVNVNNSTTLTITECVNEFKGYARKTVEGTLEMSRIVIEARKLSGKKDFGEFCNLIGFEKRSSTIKKLQCIGKKYEFLKGVKYDLPSNWTTLYQVSRIDNEQILDLIQSKVIHPNMTGQEILNFHLGMTDGVEIPQSTKQEFWFRCSLNPESEKSLEIVRSVIEKLKDEGLKLDFSVSLKEQLEVEELV